MFTRISKSEETLQSPSIRSFLITHCGLGYRTKRTYFDKPADMVTRRKDSELTKMYIYIQPPPYSQKVSSRILLLLFDSGCKE